MKECSGSLAFRCELIYCISGRITACIKRTFIWNENYSGPMGFRFTVLDTATSLTGVQLSAGAIMGFFSLHHRIQDWLWCPPSLLSNGYRGGALSPGAQRSGREADHSPPSSAEVKNAWSCTSAPQYVFMAWCLVKHRDNFKCVRRYKPQVLEKFMKNVLICSPSNSNLYGHIKQDKIRDSSVV
jgi:hypothetical protein